MLVFGLADYPIRVHFCAHVVQPCQSFKENRKVMVNVWSQGPDSQTMSGLLSFSLGQCCSLMLPFEHLTR